MPEIVSIDPKHHVILIESTGLICLDDLKQSLASVLEISLQSGLTKVLIDVSCQRSLPSISQLYSFASELTDQTHGMKHAIVVSDQTPKEINFVEAVASNRAAAMHIFTSKDEALLWLNEG